MSMRRKPRIVIIGGGFSGATLAIQLLRQASEPLELTVIDRSDKPGRGVAYAAHQPHLLLNVPASRMSALHDEPDHFLDWLRLNKGDLNGERFFPRSIYGEYLGDLFLGSCQSKKGGGVTWLVGNAISLDMELGRPRVLLDNNIVILADVIVLATGNIPPSVPPCLNGLDKQNLAEYAWHEDALTNIPPEGAVLILGTGLTAVDQICSLDMLGFRGKILALSRRGHFPAVHLPELQAWPGQWLTKAPSGLLPLFAAIRRQVRSAEETGTDWRAVIDSMRPHVSTLWSGLSMKDRSRFLRHLQSYWANARHRLPKQTDVWLRRLLESGRLTVIAGSLISVCTSGKQARVNFRERGRVRVQTQLVDRIVNCIGPGSPNRANSPFFTHLIEHGLARRDAHGLGIETTREGFIISMDGIISKRICAIGPIRKAALWETTAVPEISIQSAQLARLLLNTLRSDL